MKPGAIGILCWFVTASLIPRAQTEPVTALAFHPEAAFLASNGPRQIQLRSTRDASIERTIPCAWPKIASLAFHPDGKWLAVAGGTPGVNGTVALLDLAAGAWLASVTNHSDMATSVAFDASGTLLGVAGADHSARVWRIANSGAALEPALELTGHSGPVRAITFSPTRQTVLTASADRSIKVWSAADGKLLRTFSHHTEAVNALVFRPLDRTQETPIAYCASGGDDRTVRIWQPEIGRMVRIIRQHQGPIFALVFTPDGRALFSAGKEGVVRRIDADSDTVLAQWRAHDDWIYAMAISHDGTKLATGDWAGKVKLWPLKPE